MKQCQICGQKNAENAQTCAACGGSLGSSPPAMPVSATPGISTGGTQGAGGPGEAHHPHLLAKGIRLQGGNYAIGEVLGQGGFGITYKGGDMSLRRYVAIKEFFPSGCARVDNTVQPSGGLSAADYAGARDKFLEEARTLARFSDPGIVHVFGVFEENNTAYMVMEFLEGETLSKRITQKGTLPESEVVHIADKVGASLAVVHQAGLIHRDIKPDNICLTKEGRVVLIDFGTARAYASGKTMRQTTMLTPGYAPLEQYGQQARFGAYTDIYALGGTLYHALTGQIPPPAPDRTQGVDLKAPHLINSGISRNVSQALVWALQTQAPQRPQNIGDFIKALKQGAPSSATQLISPPASSGFSASQPGWEQQSPAAAPPVTPAQVGATVQHLADNQLRKSTPVEPNT